MSWRSPLLLLTYLLAPLSANADKAYDFAQTFFQPLPTKMPGSEGDSEDHVALGRDLFFETALSANHAQSCNSCHQLREGGSGADPRPTSPGAFGRKGRRNSPTVWNAGLQFRQFWDGRVDTLQAQARSPLLNPDEMALESEAQAIERLEQAGYAERFNDAFPESATPMSFDNITHSLAAFQRTLITRDRFDDYLRGDLNALSEQEKRGITRFVEIGCTACHNGALMGGQEFMKLGTARPYPNKQDEGRAEVTGQSKDRFVFKVPPLRNVGLTAPYFHDGAGATLEAAVFDTAWHQLGIEITDADVRDITAFLRSLDNQKLLRGLPQP